MTLLAKSRSAQYPEGVALTAHLLDVVHAIEAIERRHPSLVDLSGVPNLFRILRSAALLHDLGKAHPLFQAMLAGGARFAFRHEVFSLAFRWDDPRLSEGDWRLVQLAVLTHHKDIGVIKERYDIEDGEQSALPLTEEFLEAGNAVLSSSLFAAAGLGEANIPCKPPTRSEAALRIQQALAASVRHARQIRIRHLYNEAVSLAGRFLRGALIMADHSSSAGKRFVFLKPEEIKPKVAIPYAHQVQAATTVGNAILIAPTGAGKTEAALLWASGRSLSGTAPVLFYVLPYQASLNAMRERLANKGKGIPEKALALQHGKAAQALYMRLISPDYSKSAERARQMSASEKAMGRLHTAAVRILSPYQLLRAAYSLPGHECLSLTPVDSSFVFDEIHAYEVTRLAMIVAMIRHFACDLRSRLFIMTATMPTRLRALLAEILPDMTLLKADAATYAACQRHTLHLKEEELLSEAVQRDILNEAAAGRAVLVVANTVSRAQEMAADLAARTAVIVELLHGRFHAEDRIRKERALDANHGVGRRSAAGGGAILVATQVVEVSLNIDFDVLYTDPAPIEALLQRFGRVNRMPGAMRRLKPVHVCGKLASSRPYDEVEVDRSLASLQIWDNRPIDEEEVQSAIDEVYAGEFGDNWERALRAGILNFQASVLDNLRPFTSNPELEQQFCELFDGFEVVPASLRGEFERRMAEEPLLAQLLTVPITKRQFGRLIGGGLLEYDAESHYWIAAVPYGSNGLELSTAGLSKGKE